MNKKRKLIIALTTAVVGISGVALSSSQLSKPVIAAKSKNSAKGTIKLSHNAYVYDKNGKRLKKYLGSSKNTKISKGVSVKYYSSTPVKISGKKYYNVGDGAYIKAANVGYVDGKAVKSSTGKQYSTKLKHNAYIYDQDGDTSKKLLKKGSRIYVDEACYIGNKLYYRIAGKNNQFIKANNAKSLSDKLTPINTVETASAVATLNHNAYIYDGSGTSTKKLIKKNQEVSVDQLKYIGSKAYYRIKDDNYPGDDQWIKKSNIGKVTGDKIEAVNEKPDESTETSIVKLKKAANVYSDKGTKKKTNKLAKGTTVRVSELRYIWVNKDNQAELFYKMANNKSGYLRQQDISSIKGNQLVPVNSAQSAQDDVTIANANDKQALVEALDQAANLKQSSTYLLAAKAQKDAYDSAVIQANNANVAANTSLTELKKALSDLETAQKNLDGKKVQVADLNSLTSAEVNDIIALAAKDNGVETSAVQFTNNNQDLAITTANGYTQNVAVSTYAEVKAN